MQVDFVFQIAVLIMSVVIHEVSHGYAASYLGDQTARYQGRLTLNPLKHLDFVGSFLVPSLSYFLGGFIFGWAKPVPYNPYNLRPGRWSEAAVAVAGPTSNILLALIFGILLRISVSSDPAFIQITSLIVFINILLAIFNLMPIPPLDGSKVLFSLLPYRYHFIEEALEHYWFIFLLAALLLWPYLASFVIALTTLLLEV